MRITILEMLTITGRLKNCVNVGHRSRRFVTPILYSLNHIQFHSTIRRRRRSKRLGRSTKLNFSKRPLQISHRWDTCTQNYNSAPKLTQNWRWISSPKVRIYEEYFPTRWNSWKQTVAAVPQPRDSTPPSTTLDVKPYSLTHQHWTWSGTWISGPGVHGGNEWPSNQSINQSIRDF